MSDQLKPEQLEINVWIYRLDEVSREVEARWGIDRLRHLVSPETQVKWERHVSKLDQAIQDGDLAAVRDLAQGAIRGYKKLEDEAVSLHQNKNRPDVWDVHSPAGVHYRICKTVADAQLWAHQQNVNCYTLQEIAHILDGKQLTVMHPVKNEKVNTKPDPFDFKKGDSLEF